MDHKIWKHANRSNSLRPQLNIFQHVFPTFYNLILFIMTIFRLSSRDGDKQSEVCGFNWIWEAPAPEGLKLAQTPKKPGVELGWSRAEQSLGWGICIRTWDRERGKN